MSGKNIFPVVVSLTTSGITSDHINKDDPNQSSAASYTVAQSSIFTCPMTSKDGDGVLYVSKEACVSPYTP